MHAQMSRISKKHAIIETLLPQFLYLIKISVDMLAS